MTGRLYLGWQYATPYPDPGPPPRRPTPPERRPADGWMAAQCREEERLNRPLKVVCATAGTALAALVLAGLAGWLNPVLAALAAGCAAIVAVLSGNGIWQGKRALRGRLADEQRRIAALRADAERKLFAGQAEHAVRARAWQARRVAFEHQKRWYAVATPAGTRRVDVAGGTLAGWSALLATSAAFALAAGGEVTIIDLTGAAVAQDLIGYAGAGARVWVLPGDLPRCDLGLGLSGRVLADLLAVAAGAVGDEGQGRAADQAILDRISEVLGRSSIAAVVAALRVLGQIGDPADDVAAGTISAEHADGVRTMFGRSAADRIVIERAWVLESRLRELATLGSALAGPAPSGNPRIIAIDRQAGPLTAGMLGAYLAVALTHALRAAELAEGCRHTVYLLGAETLRGEIIDRLSDACEYTGTGLILGYRTLPPHVRHRLGRGDAVVAFMRLGNADEARAAAEQIGAEHRFVLAQLTETVGQSVSDSSGGSYTSTAGRTDSVSSSHSVSESVSASRGRHRDGSVVPLARSGGSRSTQHGESRTAGDTDSVSAGLSRSTAWGSTTARTEGSSESAGLTLQRSRELLVEPHELQQLPASAMIVSYAGPDGREVILTDTNPGIGALSSSTMLSLPEAMTMPAAQSGDEIAPNLGPPPPRLDWRRERTRKFPYR